MSVPYHEFDRAINLKISVCPLATVRSLVCLATTLVSIDTISVLQYLKQIHNCKVTNIKIEGLQNFCRNELIHTSVQSLLLLTQ